ncbi:Signal transduction histidine kinase [Actinacidiphila rubida]|uniref:histidine kinase n=2 Tax=Actinacidiphila rubida TaxID=310780 RepID=A0A1H8J3L4_9ACTN|nr:sensor histidine kinase [Actinacidiphila rubida]SEN75490.1 Signal transduction histidine kinase [Actinacidiphila rubida]
MSPPSPLSPPFSGRCAAVLRRAVAAEDLPLVAAAALGTLALAQAAAAGSGQGQDRASSAIAGALALALGSTVPLAFVRAQLVPAATAIAAAVLLAPQSGVTPTAAGLAALAAVLYLVGLRCRPVVALLSAVPFVVYAVGAGPGQAGGRPLAVAMLAGASLAPALGAYRRHRHDARARAAADWAYADTLLRHAARGERTRIARELHDIVAHHISALSVQAETARLTTPGLPPEGAAKLLAIGETAREALAEMRRLLGVLREDDGPAPGPAPAPDLTPPPGGRGPLRTRVARHPQPGLDQLLALVDQARETTGTVVRLTVRGAVRPLDPGVELAAFRIAQEALTNARRHAPGSAVDVELLYGKRELRVTVRDSGPGGVPVAGGHGLIGMRERTAMAGGTLAAGPGRITGFVVDARLPLPPAGDRRAA